MKSKGTLLFAWIFITLLPSCEIKKGDEMIEYISNKLEKYKHEEIIAWTERENIYPKYYMDIDSSRIKVFNLEEREFSYLDDPQFESFLIRFYEDFRIYRIMVYPDIIEFITSIRNPSWDSYSLIYFKVLKPRFYTEYPFYDSNNKPKESVGWMYKLEDKWYLESMIPSD